jgi:hypothetical protein
MLVLPLRTAATISLPPSIHPHLHFHLRPVLCLLQNVTAQSLEHYSPLLPTNYKVPLQTSSLQGPVSLYIHDLGIAQDPSTASPAQPLH